MKHQMLEAESTKFAAVVGSLSKESALAIALKVCRYQLARHHSHRYICECSPCEEARYAIRLAGEKP